MPPQSSLAVGGRSDDHLSLVEADEALVLLLEPPLVLVSHVDAVVVVTAAVEATVGRWRHSRAAK